MGFTIRAVIEGLRDRLVLIIRRLERHEDNLCDAITVKHVTTSVAYDVCRNVYTFISMGLCVAGWRENIFSTS